MSLTRTSLIGMGGFAVIGLPGDVHTTQQNALSQIAFDHLGNEFIYLKGAASVAAGSVVTYDDVAAVTLIAARAMGPVAVATGATIAATFGWYQISGSRTAKCDATGSETGKQAYVDGTAGRVDSTVVAGDIVYGMVFRSVSAANLATVQMSRPHVADTDNA